MSANRGELCFIFEDATTGVGRMFHAPHFPEAVKRTLLKFCECAQLLNECSFVKNLSGLKCSIHFANDGSIANKGVLPADEDIAAFLHRLRPIYLNDEETSFNKIANLVALKISDPGVTDSIKYWKQYYSGRDSQNIFSLKIGEKILNSDEFFKSYVNALEYHRNPTHRQYIDLIAEHFPLEVQKSMFVLLMGLKLNAINKLASFVLACLRREKGQPIILRKPSYQIENDTPIILPK